MCLVNEFDENMLLVASSNSLTSSREAFIYRFVVLIDSELYSAYVNIDDGNIRIWKDYTSRGQQKLVTAFASIQGHRPGAHGVNAVVDWQQQSGYLVCHCTTSICVCLCFTFFFLYRHYTLCFTSMISFLCPT